MYKKGIKVLLSTFIKKIYKELKREKKVQTVLLSTALQAIEKELQNQKQLKFVTYFFQSITLIKISNLFFKNL